MNRMLAPLACALALIAAPGLAQKAKPDIAESKAVELKNIASGKQRIDPAKAYIYIRSPEARAAGAFAKTPDAAEIASYEAKWRADFEKARAAYPGKLKTWQAAQKPGVKPSAKPEEPTEESFAIAPIDERMLVAFGPQFLFEKVDEPGKPKSFSYLIEVEPGEYTYLGPLSVIPGAQVFGTCYCMGSVRFRAEAGVITSLGDFLSAGWASREAMMQATIERKLLPDRTPRPTDWSVSAALAQYPHAQAELRAAGKRNNFLRAMVGRMPPVPGILGYERDVPIDLVGLAEAEATAAAAAAEAAAETSAPSDDLPQP